LTSSEEKLRKYVGHYLSGLYARNEAVGQIIEILAESSEYQELWLELPDWAKVDIREFLKGCDENTILYNISSQTKDVIAPNLIALKRWLEERRNNA